MSTLLLVLVLGTLVVTGVLVVHLIDRIKALEGTTGTRHGGGVGGDTSDPIFATLNGEALWIALASGQGPDPAELDALRRAYEPALTRHIEELLLEAGLDARQGIRVPPTMPRQVRTGNGAMTSWFPPDEALVLYGLGQEQTQVEGDSALTLSQQIAEACNRLREAIGLPGTLPMGQAPIAASGVSPQAEQPSSAPAALNKN